MTYPWEKHQDMVIKLQKEIEELKKGNSLFTTDIVWYVNENKRLKHLLDQYHIDFLKNVKEKNSLREENEALKKQLDCTSPTTYYKDIEMRTLIHQLSVASSEAFKLQGELESARKIKEMQNEVIDRLQIEKEVAKNQESQWHANMQCYLNEQTETISRQNAAQSKLRTQINSLTETLQLIKKSAADIGDLIK